MQNSKQHNSLWNVYRYKIQIKNRADWLLQVGYTTLTLLMKSGLHSHAKAVSYSALPFLLLLVYLINTYLVGYPEVREAFNSLIIFTHLNFMSQDTPQDSSQIVYDIPAWLCVILAVWTSRGLFKSIQSTFSIIFADHGRRRVSERLFPLAVPFVLLVIAFAVFGDYVTDHVDYSSLKMPLLEMTLKFLFSMVSLVALVLGTWGIAFLLYYLLPRKKPVLSSALLCSLFFILSTLALIAILGNTLKMDYYSRLYGMLGEFIYVLIWVYLGSIFFFFWAEFLYVSGKIDIFALEKIFLESESLSKLEHKIEHFLFDRSKRIFEKYGQHFMAGEVIIRQNDDTDSIYFLYSGRIGLYRECDGKKTRIGELKAGEIFGEMAYLLGEKRAATAVTETECFLFTLSPAIFEEMISHSTSFSARVIESLCQRISKMNQGNLASSISSAISSATKKHPIYHPEAGDV
ncbi:MAG: YhjD/YihY/BrkB family envelope integrity protein [Gallionella sp.]|nr:YhjD/YihY/BrkB family envelope integrity protein [Gallionella sp.]